jgi:hypothetical protein
MLPEDICAHCSKAIRKRLRVTSEHLFSDCTTKGQGLAPDPHPPANPLPHRKARQALKRFDFTLKQNLSPNALKSLISGSVR